MGQKLSQSKETIVIKVFLEKYFPNYRLLQVLNNGIMYKTLLIIRDKAPLVVKIFLKKYYDDEDNKCYTQEKNKLISVYKAIFSIKNTPFIAPITNIEESYLSGLIFRQYFEYSLKERIYLNPYLTEIEKIWIIFQLMYNLYNLNELNLVHGDLNPENVLLTSNLSVYISDIATYKPAYIGIDDIASYTYYFGSNDNTSLKGFYLAPERLVEKGKNPNGDKTMAMDVFSLGVIIAELFLEKNIFTFSSMINYKKGNKTLFDIDENLNKIKNPNIKKLIYDMIKIDPKERITIEQALHYYSTEVCPITMRGFLIHFNYSINNTVFWKPDLIIGYFYRFWNSVWKMIFGVNSKPLVLKRKLNLKIINQLIIKNQIIQDQSNSISKFEENKFILNIFNNNNGGNIIVKNETGENIFEKNNNKDCLLIVINYLVKNMKNVKYETSNLVAMEMVKNLSSKMDDISKLKIIIPYFVDNIKRKSFTTKLTSLNYLFEILYSFNYNELILPVTEYNYFDSYIFPVLLKLYYSGKNELILEFFNNVDKMIELEQKFLNVTMKSRILKYKNSLLEKKTSQNFVQSNASINSEGETNKSVPPPENNLNNNYISKKDKKNEIFKDYETSLMQFKEELFRVTGDLLVKINEIDILITAVRKLPKLLSFFGKNKTDDFVRFIINNFNKEDWIIHKEILIHIPEMVKTLGEKALNLYFLLCIEMLITKNSNEIKTYELIRSIHELLKMEYLQHETTVSIFNKLIPCLVHPNLLIRHEFIDFTKSMINYLSQEEINYYLLNSLSQYFFIPLLDINNNINIDEIIKYKKVNLDRVIYQLELNNILYTKSDLYNYNDSLALIQKMIFDERKGDEVANDNGDINYCFDGLERDNFSSNLNKIKLYTLEEKFLEYYKKTRPKISNDPNSIGDNLNALIGQIFWICSEIESNNKRNSNLFDEKDSLINSNFFNLLKIFKILGVSMKLYNFTKLNEIRENKNISNTTREKENHIFSNYYYDKSFNNWRPQGQLMTTLYSHNKNSVKKLIPLNDNRICSFDSLGKAILWKLSKKDETILFKKERKFGTKDNTSYPILYKNTIGLIDNLLFLFGSKNILCQYEIECDNKPAELIKTKDESNISCVEIFGKSSLELQKVIFCTEKGEINLYDQRMHKVALSTKIPFENGKPNCIKQDYYESNFYIGTSGGYLLNYDLRYNSIIKEFSHYNSDPITGLFQFAPTKSNIYDFSSNDNYSKYYVIFTASDTHEVGLWNYKNLNCDLLLKVNTIISNETSYNLDVDFPDPLLNTYIERKNALVKNDIFSNFKNMYKYTNIYNNNYIKRLSMNHYFDDFYYRAFSIMEKTKNFYKNPSTVQCISSPLCDMNNQGMSYDNCSYIITAGNDKTIRYWDITKEGINSINGNNLSDKGSYIINAPNDVSYCNYSKSTFTSFSILQSNEFFGDFGKRTNIPGFSEYQNFNGITYHTVIQNEFDQTCSGDLKYCTKISDPSHKGAITDLLCFHLNSNDEQTNILLSSSLDGTIKIWK